MKSRIFKKLDQLSVGIIQIRLFRNIDTFLKNCRKDIVESEYCSKNYWEMIRLQSLVIETILIIIGIAWIFVGMKSTSRPQ